MALDTTNQFISKTETGFPAYLNFDFLRRQGIDYLGKLSGKIWTDHNVHDPGITILEVLCYAILDLGYKANFPVIDTFARAPGDTSQEDNFFTPAQALSNNPLTVLDYRKLLIDIKEVNNAWLEPADDFDVEQFCNPRRNPEANDAKVCETYLNGLYHVYIDPVLNSDTTIPGDEYEKIVLQKVKHALLCHRNFCEDFLDIVLLLPQEIGVCCDIELAADADVERVYLDVLQALQSFISPSPKFYTLQQMLNKGKTTEEIYNGRPLI